MTLPRNLRLVPKKDNSVSFKSVPVARISGSAQFSEAAFHEMLQEYALEPEKLIVFDLRQESHGMVNGIPVSWTDGIHNFVNLDKTAKEIEADEQQKLKQVSQAGTIVVDPFDKNVAKFAVNATKTEREIVESVGATYIRLPVVDHCRPTDQIIDQFIEIVKILPKDKWLHFHCKGGKGRTTTFMSFLDIMNKSDRMTFDEIIAYQSSLGGQDLHDFNKISQVRSDAAEERLELLRKFYAYYRAVPKLDKSWSQWISEQS
jgi:protein-tyrosine phosphatase